MHTNLILLLRFIIQPSSDDIQPSTLITDQSPTGLLLDIKVTGICFSHTLYISCISIKLSGRV